MDGSKLPVREMNNKLLLPEVNNDLPLRELNVGSKRKRIRYSHDSSLPSPDKEATSTKKSAERKKSPITRKRKLHPDDEHTLKILSEKFRNEPNGAVCQIDNCTSQPMKCVKPSNLKRHISQLHPKEYAYLFPNEVCSKKQSELEAFNIVQDAIELVTINGYPFSMLSSSSMKGFVKSRLKTVLSEQHVPPIDRNHIVKYVAEESKLVKERIKKELKGKTLSIMFDVCTKSTLSMLGVHAVFMNNNAVVCRSLGTIQIEERHTSVYLADMVYDILAEFCVNLPQIFSVTTDTAYNAVATTDVLDAVASSKNDDDIAEESVFDVGPDDDGFDFGIDIENQAELQKVMDNVTSLVEEMATKISVKNTSMALINQINCCTHVVQLTVNGALIDSQNGAMETIQIVHDMCNLMRTQVVMIHVRKLKQNIILPPMDNITRWNSKYIMVSIS